jgi:hypothetical protein
VAATQELDAKDRRGSVVVCYDVTVATQFFLDAPGAVDGPALLIFGIWSGPIPRPANSLTASSSSIGVVHMAKSKQAVRSKSTSAKASPSGTKRAGKSQIVNRKSNRTAAKTSTATVPTAAQQPTRVVAKPAKRKPLAPTRDVVRTAKAKPQLPIQVNVKLRKPKRLKPTMVSVATSGAKPQSPIIVSVETIDRKPQSQSREKTGKERS